MDLVLDLSNLNADRYLIVGNIKGNYEKLVEMLYHQKFSYKDVLISTGNFLDTEINKSLEVIMYLKNMVNSYSVKGKNEFDFLRHTDTQEVPVWFKNHPKTQELLNFIEELPLIIKVSDYFYIVNSGVEPGKHFSDQNPEVFYSIGKYDKDSRFYQFNNPDKKSWYDFEITDDTGKPVKICFSNLDAGAVEVPAGFCLYSLDPTQLNCIVLRKDSENPILVTT